MSADDLHIWQKHPGFFLLIAILVFIASLWMTSEGQFWVPGARFDAVRGYCLSIFLYWVYRYFRG